MVFRRGFSVLLESYMPIKHRFVAELRKKREVGKEEDKDKKEEWEERG